MKRVGILAFIIFSALALSQAAAAQKSKNLGAQLAPNVSKSTRFDGISALTDGRSTWLTWQMAAEVGNVGFNVYRINRRGSADLLTPVRIVSGSAMHAREIPQYGGSYFFYDHNGNGSSAYYVETIGLDGRRLASQQIYATYVPSLSAATGLSEEQMVNTTFHPTTIESAVPVFTKDLGSEIEESRQLADGTTHRMVISQPGVVRIGVKGEGLFRVTSAQLGGAGFDTASDSTNWQLYVEGVEQAILVGPGGSYIEFYGRGTDTAETDTRQYYLMNGSSAGKRMTSQIVSANTSTVVSRSISQTFVKKERINFVEDIFNGDLENYFGRSVTTSPSGTTMTFNLSEVDFATLDSSMQLRFQGYSAGDHAIEVILNGQILDPATGADLQNFTKDYSIPTSLLHEGSNSIRFRATASGSDFVWFDTISITFNRRFVAQNNRLNFPTVNYRAAQVGGFSSADVRVFDITRDGNPILMTGLSVQPSGPTFGVTMPATRTRSFFAVSGAGLLAPDSVTANNPELVGIPTNGADLIIIAYKDFLTQAETWAQYRRGQGFTVKVIEVSELYDEFNYGTFSSYAIRDFLQYAYESWQTRPSYVMLIGDASFDSRGYENLGKWNLIPPRMVRTRYAETASDDALVDFNADGLSEIAIGRIPVRNVTDLNTIYNKTLNWESALSPTTTDRGALFAYDFNSGYTFDLMSQRLRNQLPSTMPSTFVYRGEVDANANLINAMNTGKYIINYSGHGTAGSWGGNPTFFNSTLVPTTADHNPAIYTMLTCLNGYYHWLYFNSISETLLVAQNRGAVVAWASSTLTLPDAQEDMATRFYLKIGDGTIPRIGDLVRDAKVQVVGTDLRFSWALLGDPMLKVR